MCCNYLLIYIILFVLQNYGGLLYLINNYLWMSFIFILCIIENGISYKLKRVCNVILYYIVFSRMHTQTDIHVNNKLCIRIIINI